MAYKFHIREGTEDACILGLLFTLDYWAQGPRWAMKC